MMFMSKIEIELFYLLFKIIFMNMILSEKLKKSKTKLEKVMAHPDKLLHFFCMKSLC